MEKSKPEPETFSNAKQSVCLVNPSNTCSNQESCCCPSTRFTPEKARRMNLSPKCTLQTGISSKWSKHSIKTGREMPNSKCFGDVMQANQAKGINGITMQKGIDQKGKCTNFQSQGNTVSPPKITSPVGALVKYLPGAVGPWAESTSSPKC